jgi:hypothetical protein
MHFSPASFRQYGIQRQRRVMSSLQAAFGRRDRSRQQSGSVCDFTRRRDQRLGLLLFVVSAINLLVMYFLALRRFFLIPVTLIGAGALAFLVFLSHASLLQIVQDFLAVALAVLLILGWSVFAVSRESVAKTAAA